MGFKVSARTILQLGAELISSDSVAFYELIKNAFDAQSPQVDISLVARLSHAAYEELCQYLANANKDSHRDSSEQIEVIRHKVLSNLISEGANVGSYKQKVIDAEMLEQLAILIRDANYIDISDKGHGMSFDDLKQVYLTIGTRSRREERETLRVLFKHNNEQVTDETRRPVLGEKGVGRLSTMRLGNYLEVTTSRAGERHWNKLNIDWTIFSHESDQLLEDIDIAPELGEEKGSPDTHGTSVRISALNSEWSRIRLEEIAKSEFSKLTDPFTPASRYPIKLTYNNEPVRITPFNKMILEWAHAVVEGHFSKSDLKLAGKMDLRLYDKQKYFQLDSEHLYSVTGVTAETLRSLGSFSFKFYWYNRQLLKAIDAIGNQKEIRELVGRWAGGLMLYRDGFRVFPYGNPDDDWLGLDKQALSSGGYKLNRQQFIGKVDITSLGNPRLMDQTNREGLTQNEEKNALVKLLYYAIRTEFKAFMDSVNKEMKARSPVDIETLDERVSEHQHEIANNLNLLLKEYPQINRDDAIISRIRESANEMQAVMKEVQRMGRTFDNERSQTIHLAGLGLMVEVLAHELNRATSHALATLTRVNTINHGKDVSSIFATLESQLKTLQQRLRILDPLSTSGRQRKETFDLVAWVRQTLDAHIAQFNRHHIDCQLLVEPVSSGGQYRVTAVKGMIVQVLENLISNSVYWLKQRKKMEVNFSPRITVTVDTQSKEVRVWDNGPGVPLERQEDIFHPFFTTKPPGEGRGLGLFISREIAHYHGGDLYLSSTFVSNKNRLNTFVFTWEAKSK